jgi:hypothetical protein
MNACGGGVEANTGRLVLLFREDFVYFAPCLCGVLGEARKTIRFIYGRLLGLLLQAAMVSTTCR